MRLIPCNLVARFRAAGLAPIYRPGERGAPGGSGASLPAIVPRGAGRIVGRPTTAAPIGPAAAWDGWRQKDGSSCKPVPRAIQYLCMAQRTGRPAGRNVPVTGQKGRCLMLVDWPTVESVICGLGVPGAPVRLALLFGPPGTGKTTAAVRAGGPETVYSLTLCDETPAASLSGHFVPEGGNFVWMDGPALRAFRGGHRLILNEIDHASGDCLDFLQGLLDDPGIARLDLPSGESVLPGAGFHCVATMNGVPGDLPEALRDRFAITFNIDEPHPNALAAFPDAVKDAILGTVAVDDDDRRTSLRAWKSYVGLATTVGEEVAARSVFGHRADEVLSALKMAAER